MTLESIRYAIQVHLVGANIEPSTTGGFFLEVGVNGERMETTPVERMNGGKVQWNKRFTLYVESMEPPTPTVVTISLYKKRMYWTGQTLIGSCHFPTTELISLQDKGAVRSRAILYIRKRHMIKFGAILLRISVQTIVGGVEKTTVTTTSDLTDSDHTATPAFSLSPQTTTTMEPRSHDAPRFLVVVLLVVPLFVVTLAWLSHTVWCC